MSGKRTQGGGDRADVGLVARVLPAVREDDLAAGRDDERAAELMPVLLRRAQRLEPRALERLQRGARREHVARRAALEVHRLVGLLVGRQEHGEADPGLLLERSRVRGRAHPHEPQPPVETLPMTVQLHRLRAAVQSAVMAQEDQRRRALRPQVAQTHVRARIVGECDLFEGVRHRRVT